MTGSEIYNYPEYYDIAFSFRDIPAEVDVFEDCIRSYAKIPVHTFLELACGNSPHMLEICNRGYKYVGLDINEEMLRYSRNKVSTPIEVELKKGDLCHFTLSAPVEFAFIALGSLYVKDAGTLESHFRSMAQAIKKGGLYFLDWCIYFNTSPTFEQSWEIERDGVVVQTTVKGRVIEPVQQLYKEEITFEVDAHGRKESYRGIDSKRLLYPQEFLLYVEHETEFEFVGWWNNWNLNESLPGTVDISRPIVVLRRR